MITLLRRSALAVVMAVAATTLGYSVIRAAEVEARGLLDSVVDTLVGGNPGDGFTDARQAPLQFVRGGAATGGGIARDSSGAIYVTENHRILKLSAGAVSVVAGAAGLTGYRGDGDLATRAVFNRPTHLAVDGSDNIYVLDVLNRRIRRINKADGTISTIAGNGIAGGGIADVNRPATDARLNTQFITGLAANAAGDLFYADSNVSVIYKVAAADGLLTIAGGNGAAGIPRDDVAAVGNPLGPVTGIAVNAGGDVIYGSLNAVRKIKASDGRNKIIAGVIDAATPANLQTGIVPTLPDTGYAALQVNAAPASGTVGNAAQLAMDGSTIVFWDTLSSNFRSFTEGGTLQTVFGPQDTANVQGFRGDGAASATNTTATTDDDPRARPVGVINAGVVAAGGMVTFVDLDNNRVRQFTIGGNAATIAGSYSPFRAANGLATNAFVFSDDGAVGAKGATIRNPRNIANGPAGVLYFDGIDQLQDQLGPAGATKVYKYDHAAKTISVVAGTVIVNGFRRTPGDGGPATGASLAGLGAQIAADGNSIYFAETTPGILSRMVVRKIDANAAISTVAGIAGVSGAIDPDGDGSLATPTTTRVGKAATAVLLNPIEGVAVTSTDILLAETATGRVLKVNKSTGVLTHANTAPLSINPTFLAAGRADGGILVGARNSADIVIIDGAGIETVWATLAGGSCRGLAVSGTTLYAANSNGDIEKYDLNAAVPVPPAVVPAALTITNVNVAWPGGIAVAGTTVTYADTTLLVQFVDTGVATPVLTTVAGKYFSVAGTGGVNLNVGFAFNWAAPLAMSGTDILVGDQADVLLRKLTPVSTATPNVPPEATAVTVAGTGNDGSGLTGEGGPATTAMIGLVGGIAVASDGALLFSDTNAGIVRRVSTAGIIDTYAGIPGRNGYSGDGQDRLATILNSPQGVAYNGTGELHVSEQRNHIVRKVQADGKVVLIAGTPTQSGYAGDGYAGTAAKLNNPSGIAFDKNGDLLLCDSGNHVLRILSSKGVMSTLAGDPINGHSVAQQEASALEAYVGAVQGVAIDASGKVYSVDGTDTGTMTRTAGGFSRAVVGEGNASGFNGDGLPGLETMIASSYGVAFDESLGLVFTDSGNNRVRRAVNLAETTSSAPEAAIVATPDRLGQAPLKVRFDGTPSLDSDGDIVSYAWDFGDGSRGDGPIVEHIYSTPGSYTATLTVTDTQGNTSAAKTTVFVALPMIGSSTSTKGSFRAAFGPKAGAKDAFALSMKNVSGLTTQAGKPARIHIGSFFIDATVGGKGVKAASKTVKLTIDPSAKKKMVTIQIKSVKLSDTLAELGVNNENTFAPGKTALIPIVVVVDGGALVLGDRFLFLYKGKYNSGASGKCSQ